MTLSRRAFVGQTLAGTAALAALPLLPSLAYGADDDSNITFGLCTYQWGKDWDLPTVIANCEKAGVKGVELRVEHAHKVSPSLTEAERTAVREQFEKSKVQLIGLGTNQAFDSPDPEKLKASIEMAKQFVTLSHDIGGSGVKVKPNDFHKEVPHEKTIEQIGKSLNELGEYAEGFGQQIRLEVHGSCCELPTIKAIMDIAKDPNVAVCWNSNAQDLIGDGLAANFALVQKRLGATTHIRELEYEKYPTQDLLNLLVKAKYQGWVLIESSNIPKDIVAALADQQKRFPEMLAIAEAAAKK